MTFEEHIATLKEIFKKHGHDLTDDEVIEENARWDPLIQKIFDIEMEKAVLNKQATK